MGLDCVPANTPQQRGLKPVNLLRTFLNPIRFANWVTYNMQFFLPNLCMSLLPT